MRTLIAILLMASSTSVLSAENLPMPASSQAGAGSTGGVTTTTTTTSGATGATSTVTTTTPAPSPTGAAKPAPTGAAPSFKTDLAHCKSMAAEDRRTCERETYAARAEGLYR